jgi:anti-anti-sigma factor
MTFREDVEQDVVVFAISGKLFAPNDVGILRTKVREYISRDYKKFVLDMADVPWINSEGIGLIAVIMATVSGIGGRVVLANISPKVKQVLNVTKCDRIIQVYKSRDIAVSSFDGS